jgi:hypothetical protein
MLTTHSETVTVWLDGTDLPTRLVHRGVRYRIIDHPTPLPPISRMAYRHLSPTSGRAPGTWVAGHRTRGRRHASRLRFARRTERLDRRSDLRLTWAATADTPTPLTNAPTRSDSSRQSVESSQFDDCRSPAHRPPRRDAKVGSGYRIRPVSSRVRRTANGGGRGSGLDSWRGAREVPRPDDEAGPAGLGLRQCRQAAYHAVKKCPTREIKRLFPGLGPDERFQVFRSSSRTAADSPADLPALTVSCVCGRC